MVRVLAAFSSRRARPRPRPSMPASARRVIFPTQEGGPAGILRAATSGRRRRRSAPPDRSSSLESFLRFKADLVGFVFVDAPLEGVLLQAEGSLAVRGEDWGTAEAFVQVGEYRHCDVSTYVGRCVLQNLVDSLRIRSPLHLKVIAGDGPVRDARSRALDVDLIRAGRVR